MARVFEGVRESLAGVTPRVAIKVILPDYANHPGFRDLFVNEARIGSLLRHQNLVQIQDFDCVEGIYYLVMEYVEGATLRQVIRQGRQGGLAAPLDVVVDVGRQICDGLHHLHTQEAEGGGALGLVHRDLKPSNLIVNPQGVVKLLDFGVSKALRTREREGSVRGTWGYMPPEQARAGDVGPAADLFGLAAVLYEFVALQPLFPEKEAEQIKILMDQDEAARRAYQLVGSCGPLAGVLVRALQRDPMARFQSAAAMGRALGDLVTDPVRAREEVVRFQARITGSEAEAAGPGKGAVAVIPTDAKPTSQGPSAAAASAAVLPVGVGTRQHPHRAASPPRKPRKRRKAPGLPWVAMLGSGFMLLAVCIVAFTAWRVLGGTPTDPVATPVPVVVPPAVRPAPDAVETMAAEPELPAPSPVAPRSIPAVTTSVAPEPASTPAPAPEVDEPAPEADEAGPETTVSEAREALLAELEEAEASTETVADGAATDELAGDDGGGVPLEEAAPAAPTVGTMGQLTVGSTPRSQVLLDGQFVRLTPLFRHSVPAGDHKVTLISEDGRRITFQVTIEAGQESRRIWSFEEGDWVGD